MGYVGVASARHLALVLMFKQFAVIVRGIVPPGNPPQRDSLESHWGVPLTFTRPVGFHNNGLKYARAQQWFKIYALGIRRRFAGKDSYVFLAAIIFLTM